MTSPYSCRGFGVLLLAVLFLGGSAVAEAGSRGLSSRSTFVPRSTGEGVIPGAFGRRDLRFQRQRLDRQRIESFQEQTRIRARQREILRKERGPVTNRRAPPPSNRLSDRLLPQVAPLGHLPRRKTNQADNQLFLQSPPTDSRGEPREALSPRRHDIAPFSYIDRSTR